MSLCRSIHPFTEILVGRIRELQAQDLSCFMSVVPLTQKGLSHWNSRLTPSTDGYSSGSRLPKWSNRRWYRVSLNVLLVLPFNFQATILWSGAGVESMNNEFSAGAGILVVTDKVLKYRDTTLLPVGITRRMRVTTKWTQPTKKRWCIAQGKWGLDRTNSCMFFFFLLRFISFSWFSSIAAQSLLSSPAYLIIYLIIWFDIQMADVYGILPAGPV